MTLQQLDPIYVDFTLPEQAFAQIQRRPESQLQTDALPGATFTGEITAINAKVDEATRNVQVRATFANADHKLLPGMFAHVLSIPGRRGEIHHPAADRDDLQPLRQHGLSWSTKTTSAKSPLVASKAFVTTGPTRGDQVAVLSGVKEGDEVVTSGQIKLRNGRPIVDQTMTIQPSERPEPEAAGAVDAMKFTDIFIRRPVLATVVSLMILVLGLRALHGAAGPASIPRTENAVVTVSHDLLRRRRRTPSRASSPRRSKTRSPRPTASIT